MEESRWPKVELDTGRKAVAGQNRYQAIPESVEFRRLQPAPQVLVSLGLGRLVLSLDKSNGELASLHCFVKTGRWKTEGTAGPPQPDSEGVLRLSFSFGDEDFAFLSVTPRFMWHEESHTLRIMLEDGLALVFRVADCLLVGIDREGGLSDVWMTDLDIGV